MHSSFFNYAITRPYPYKWFTPVVVIGGVILLVLLSVMNFVQNSYSLTVEYSSNPNTTITNSVWFNKWPSYLTRNVQPTCQPANLPINTQFFTNQTGLMWTLTGVYLEKESSDALPSLTYMNNLLDSCNVTSIQEDITTNNAGPSSAPIPGISLDIEVRAFVTCGVWSTAGYTMFNATAMYDRANSHTIPGSTIFVATNATTRSSMFWAQTLLSAFWTNLAAKCSDVVLLNPLRPLITGGMVKLQPDRATKNIQSRDFFELWYRDWSPTKLRIPGSAQEHMHTVEHFIQRYHHLSETTHLVQAVDDLGKAMYSAVLADLGQFRGPVESNILARSETLQNFTSKFREEFNYTYNPLLFPDYQPEFESYDEKQASSNPSGPLVLTPSIISTNYLCQVPRRKRIGDIFLSVLLADLVLLQAAWKLYTFGVDLLFLRRREATRHCEGCENLSAVEDEVEGRRLGKVEYDSRSCRRDSVVSILRGACVEVKTKKILG